MGQLYTIIMNKFILFRNICWESQNILKKKPAKRAFLFYKFQIKITFVFCIKNTYQDGICQGDFLPKLSFYVKASFAIVIFEKDVFSIFNMIVVKSFLRISIGFQNRHNHSAMNNKRYERIIRDTFHNIFKSRTASRFEITYAFTLWNRIKAHWFYPRLMFHRIWKLRCGFSLKQPKVCLPEIVHKRISHLGK